MKKYIIVLTKDERTELINGQPTPYQKPVKLTNDKYEVGKYFTLKLSLPDMLGNQVKELVLVFVEKVIQNVIFVKIPNTEKIK